MQDRAGIADITEGRGTVSESQTSPGESRVALPWTTHSLSVFVAAFNEVDNLGPTVDTIMRAASVSVEECEIIIVNDGSSDGTREVADELAAKYPQVKVIHNERNM